MDRFDGMKIFAAVVEEGGFSAAARVLRIPLPTVSRKVSELEEHLGVRLLVRTTRKVSVTESGRRYYQDTLRILNDIEAAEREVSGEFLGAKGLLTITAPELFARRHVLPVVHEVMRKHEDIAVRLIATNRVLDLDDDGVDLAVRMGELSSSALHAVRLGSMRQVICVSPDYLDVVGRPSSPHDLPGRDCIGFNRWNPTEPWKFLTRAGRKLEIKAAPRLTLDSAGAVVDALISIGGFAPLFLYQAAPDVAAGRLEVVLQDYEIEPVPVNMVISHPSPAPRKVVAFLECAVPSLKASLSAL